MTTLANVLLDKFERAAMAYERLGKLTRDDEKTREMRKEVIADLANSRKAILALLSRPAQPAGEAVVWQYRAKYGNEWTDWHNVKDDDLRQKQMDAAEYRDTLELRTLFAHPSPQPADMGKAVEAIDAVIDEYSDPIYDCPTNRAVVVGLKDARQRALRLASEAEGQERG